MIIVDCSDGLPTYSFLIDVEIFAHKVDPGI